MNLLLNTQIITELGSYYILLSPRSPNGLNISMQNTINQYHKHKLILGYNGDIITLYEVHNRCTQAFPIRLNLLFISQA